MDLHVFPILNPPPTSLTHTAYHIFLITRLNLSRVHFRMDLSRKSKPLLLELDSYYEPKFPDRSAGKNTPAKPETEKKRKKRIHLPMQKTSVRSLGQEDPLEKEMATHSGMLAWEITWTEEPGRLQSMGLQKIWT